MKSFVNVHNEWDPIEEIIVGTSIHASLPSEKYFESTLESEEEFYKTKYPFIFPQKIIEETEEDINIFVDELIKLGITVKRPKPLEAKEKFKTLDWEVEHFFCYCPRDLLLAIGNTLIECPSGFRSRYFETFSYQDILLEYFNNGSKWISAPKPRLLDSSYDYERKENGLILREREPIFDAANVLRAGRDLFYLVSDSGNKMGGKWLQNVLGDEYKVHFCENIYSSVHIDTTICLLRPGLLLLNPEVNRDLLPEALKKWDIIEAPEMVEVNYSDIRPMASAWLGMNLLMLAPDLAMVDKNQKELIKLLNMNKINVIPVLLRHGRILGGGPHCITLDVRRTGDLQNYF